MTQPSVDTDDWTITTLDDKDLSRLRSMDEIIRNHSDRELFLRMLDRGIADHVIEKLSELCTFAHGALLTFPEAIGVVPEALRILGYGVGKIVPSTVTKSRISSRYRFDDEDFQLHIVHGSTSVPSGQEREIEVFMSTTPSIARLIAWEERAFEYETHFAVKVNVDEGHTLTDVANLLTTETGFRRDGGGYNPFENKINGGTTLMYFIRPAQSQEDRLFRRLEVQCAGNFSHLLSTNPADETGDSGG